MHISNEIYIILSPPSASFWLPEVDASYALSFPRKTSPPKAISPQARACEHTSFNVCDSSHLAHRPASRTSGSSDGVDVTPQIKCQRRVHTYPLPQILSIMPPSPLRSLHGRRLCIPSFTRNFTSSRRALADHVRIVEVGPRDGLQNEKTSIPAETKIELVNRLARTGLKTIEAGSFVHPKWVPQVRYCWVEWVNEQLDIECIQMAASDKVLSSMLTKPPPGDITYQWLLPNMKGLENFFSVMNNSSSSGDSAYPTPPPSPTNDAGPALNTSSQDPNAMPSSTSGVDAMSKSRTTNPQKHEVSIFMAATETFSQKNTNCSIAESLSRFAPLITSASQAGYPVRAYISVALGCPFEGPDVDPHRVAELCATLLELGADEISVADTTGMGTAPATRELLKTLKEAGVQTEDLAMHFHDTFGQALINTMVSLDHGVRTFDSAVGGLGGCPYSPGATGNVSTEDLVHFLSSLGVETGCDMEELSRIGDWITKEIGKGNGSSAGRATMARLTREGRA